MINRRTFIKQSGLAMVGTMLMPSFLKGMEMPADEKNDRILIIIQLSGGNDGLNTVVPFQNDIYYKLRPTLALPKEKVIRITDELGFNPAMEKMQRLYDKGYLHVINNVGYPNPDRSHFRSMDIWQSASSATEYSNTGWVGRFLDTNCDGKEHNAIEIDDTLSLALKGNTIKSMALRDPVKLYKATHNRMFKSIAGNIPDHDELVQYLYKTAAETTSSAAYIYNTTKIYKNTAVYPNDEFGRRLKTIGTLINSGVTTKVYYAALSGFDTHISQTGKQERLLRTYSDAVAALVDDLESKGNLDRVMIMTFSEFGRRVGENASGGTDHGTANNVFVMGGKLRTKGFEHAKVDLNKLDDGDLIFETDFRSIYATLLQRWLATDASSILGAPFPILQFV